MNYLAMAKRKVGGNKGEPLKPTVKHACVSIVLWCCFVANSTVTLHKVDEIIKKEDYKSL